MHLRHLPSAVLCLVALGLTPLHATYSIVASDPMTGQCGVAVQTDNLAVGASVPYAQAGVGAIASQFETNPLYGPRGLVLLAQGKSPAEVLSRLLAEDGNFEGRGIEARQVAVVSVDGRTAVHTGTDAAQADWAGSRSGKGYSVQGNGLAGPQVLESMEPAFLNTGGSLADRLVAPLSAGDAAGGQKTGRESAALLVRTREGFPLDVDLRVAHSDDPVGQLNRLHALQSGRQQIIQARIAGKQDRIDEARALLLATIPRIEIWPRAEVLAAEVAVEIEEPAMAVDCLSRAFTQNPARISSVLGDGTFAIIGADPRFRRWISPELERHALSLLNRLSSAPATTETRLEVASQLLEAGHAAECLVVLNRFEPNAGKSAEYALSRVTALDALGNLDANITQCGEALKIHPADTSLRLRLHRIRSEKSKPTADTAKPSL